MFTQRSVQLHESSAAQDLHTLETSPPAWNFPPGLRQSTPRAAVTSKGPSLCQRAAGQELLQHHHQRGPRAQTDCIFHWARVGCGSLQPTSRGPATLHFSVNYFHPLASQDFNSSQPRGALGYSLSPKQTWSPCNSGGTRSPWSRDLGASAGGVPVQPALVHRQKSWC